MFHLASVRKGTLWDSGKKERVEPWDDVSHMRWDGPGPRGRQKIEELSEEKKKKKIMVGVGIFIEFAQKIII
jgi:hypothetical protein